MERKKVSIPLEAEKDNQEFLKRLRKYQNDKDECKYLKAVEEAEADSRISGHHNSSGDEMECEHEGERFSPPDDPEMKEVPTRLEKGSKGDLLSIRSNASRKLAVANFSQHINPTIQTLALMVSNRERVLNLTDEILAEEDEHHRNPKNLALSQAQARLRATQVKEKERLHNLIASEQGDPTDSPTSSFPINNVNTNLDPASREGLTTTAYFEQNKKLLTEEPNGTGFFSAAMFLQSSNDTSQLTHKGTSAHVAHGIVQLDKPLASQYVCQNSVTFQEDHPLSIDGTAVKEERLQFELSALEVEDIDIRTQALLIIGKLIHVDPSRKIVPYMSQDAQQYPNLNHHYDIPQELDEMKIYLAHPQHNPRTKILVFYTKSITTTPITLLRRDHAYFQ